MKRLIVIYSARVRLIEQACKILPEQEHVALLEMTPRQIHRFAPFSSTKRYSP